jgi:acetyl-CoA C-acetyltransferase
LGQGPEDLLVDAAYQAYESAGVQPDDVDAYWLGTMGSGISGLTLSEPLKIQYKPVTRVENMCATGSEALRQACYAVASGAFDIAMAIGVEKLKDSGYSGLVMSAPPNDGTEGSMTAPASFSLLAPAYFKKYGLDPDKGKDVLTRIAWKNHKNGAKNPKAQFQKEVSLETIKNSPKIADPLGIMDCSGVSDGSAAAIVVRAEDAHKYCKNPIYMKALSFVAGPAEGPLSQEYDFTTFREVVASADAYAQAGITNPREQISMAEVHDCFTPTELVLMEDLGFSPRGTAWQDVMDGFFDLDGHAAGKSGRRPQVVRPSDRRLGPAHDVRDVAADARRSGPRQINNPKVGLTHNLGG